VIVDAHVHPHTWPTVYNEKPKTSAQFRALLSKDKGKNYFKLFREEPIDHSDLLIKSMDRTPHELRRAQKSVQLWIR
jgi:hypothetical protein